MSQNKVSEFQIPADVMNNSPSVDDMRRNVYQAYVYQEIQPSEKNESKLEISKDKLIESIYTLGADIEAAREKEIARTSPNKLKHINNMRSFFYDVSSLLFSRKMPYLSVEEVMRNELIARESVIGATIFGLASSKSNRYEFFYEGSDDKRGRLVGNWFYHEDKNIDFKEVRESKTLHYEILDDGVYLVGVGYLDGEDLNRFWQITQTYHKNVMKKIYQGSDLSKNNNFSSKATKKIIDFIDKNGLGGSDFAA